MLYPQREHTQLALKLFRGEPAITEFDRNFSAIHSSSPRVARRVGSVLLPTFVGIQPGHGWLTQFRVVCQLLNRPIQTRFPYAFSRYGIKLATDSTLTDSFFNRNTVIPPLESGGLQLFVSIWFQVLFHRPLRATFHLSLTVLVHYRSLKVFSLTA